MLKQPQKTSPRDFFLLLLLFSHSSKHSTYFSPAPTDRRELHGLTQASHCGLLDTTGRSEQREREKTRAHERVHSSLQRSASFVRSRAPTLRGAPFSTCSFLGRDTPTRIVPPWRSHQHSAAGEWESRLKTCRFLVTECLENKAEGLEQAETRHSSNWCYKLCPYLLDSPHCDNEKLRKVFSSKPHLCPQTVAQWHLE